MILPDLKDYSNQYKAAGLNLPLAKIPFSGSLLQQLPAPQTLKTGWPWDEETDPKVYSENVKWPKLTIVTPSYNQAAFLEETIRSVLLQNYPNLEYIIIDGGSTDGSVEIIKKYAKWINYWESKPDRGQGHAINKGFSLSSGDYHAWINSDDYYIKGVFNLVIDKFLQTGSKFIYGYGYSYHTDKDNFHLVKVIPFLDFFIKIPGIVQPATFWASNIHQPIWEELHCSLDYELWMRLVKGNKRTLIKRPLAVANEHALAKTFDSRMKHKWAEDHQKIWAADAHGSVPEWKWISFLNRIRIKLHSAFNL